MLSQDLESGGEKGEGAENIKPHEKGKMTFRTHRHWISLVVLTLPQACDFAKKRWLKLAAVIFL